MRFLCTTVWDLYFTVWDTYFTLWFLYPTLWYREIFTDFVCLV